MLSIETEMAGPRLPASMKSKGCSVSNCSSNSPFAKLCFPLYFVVLFVASTSRLISAQGNFSVSGNSYNCSSNLICLGDAHEYAGNYSDGSFVGRLALVQGPGKGYGAGIAYYNKPIRMRDPATRQSASFSTSFVIDENPGFVNYSGDYIYYAAGDGITFLISADNSSLGSAAQCFGVFDCSTSGGGDNSFKSVVVEFDNYQNVGAPEYDISGNHVSFDFQNITWVAAANASDAGVYLWENVTTYAWVEYSAETQLLEVRISNSIERPFSPLLSYTVDLFDFVEEYMWVGFSGAIGGLSSDYYIGNWTFESSVPTLKKHRSKVASTVAISVGVPVLLGIAGIMVFFCVKRQAPGMGFRQVELGNRSFDDNLLLDSPGMAPKFSYKQLSVATGAFREESKLGQGGFGSVYRGVLPPSGTPVAVKKISADSKQGAKEFMAEVSIISQLRHRNLIQLLGWCRDKGQYLLVYQLMPNGSLDKALFRPDEQHSRLSWSQRFNIVTGIAAAVDYLHQGWNQQVIHRDIKASNIMLDNDWNAKLGDFGLARLVDHHGPAETTIVAGTYGYIAPEAAVSCKFTDKTDVFAFGAVVLETACGRKALEVNAPADEKILVDWVWHRLSEDDLLSVVDRRLGDYDTYSMEVVLLMGLLCSHPDPMSRPSMRHVVQVLAGDAPVPSVPVSKPAAKFSRETAVVSFKERSVDRQGSASGTTPVLTFSGSLTSRSKDSSVFSGSA